MKERRNGSGIILVDNSDVYIACTSCCLPLLFTPLLLSFITLSCVLHVFNLFMIVSKKALRHADASCYIAVYAPMNT